jgi:hypothetical protein
VGRNSHVDITQETVIRRAIHRLKDCQLASLTTKQTQNKQTKAWKHRRQPRSTGLKRAKKNGGILHGMTEKW